MDAIYMVLRPLQKLGGDSICYVLAFSLSPLKAFFSNLTSSTMHLYKGIPFLLLLVDDQVRAFFFIHSFIFFFFSRFLLDF